MKQLFDAQIAETLAGRELDEAREFLLSSLRNVTKIPLEPRGDADSIHCTDVHTVAAHPTPFALTWEGFIGSSDYRDDGLLVYGAHLFPLIGGRRACVMRMQGDEPTYEYAFRYLMLTPESGWKDLGWQIDEYDEFEHWYLK